MQYDHMLKKAPKRLGIYSFLLNIHLSKVVTLLKINKICPSTISNNTSPILMLSMKKMFKKNMETKVPQTDGHTDDEWHNIKPFIIYL